MAADPETCRLNGAKSKGPTTERGKAIASRNATKHGVLAQQPPILASEDLETFQGVMQGLVDAYQPANPLEWHLVQTIAMCIQRQHRVWSAEAAAGNAELLPPIEPPYTDQKYSPVKPFDSILRSDRTQYHPENLQQERTLLTQFLERYPLDKFPQDRRSKYWADIWQDWQDALQAGLKRLHKEYPVQRPTDKQLQAWLRDLEEAKHPYAVLVSYRVWLEMSTTVPSSKQSWESARSQFAEVLDCLQTRLQAIEGIEAEIQQERERYQRELEERRSLTANPLPSQVALFARYESHITKQMQAAIAQLQSLQMERKNAGSMGSFGN
jgi:hypothetical protein